MHHVMVLGLGTIRNLRVLLPGRVHAEGSLQLWENFCKLQPEERKRMLAADVDVVRIKYMGAYEAS